jgi:hypothetical protein
MPLLTPRSASAQPSTPRTPRGSLIKRFSFERKKKDADDADAPERKGSVVVGLLRKLSFSRSKKGEQKAEASIEAPEAATTMPVQPPAIEHEAPSTFRITRPILAPNQAESPAPAALEVNRMIERTSIAEDVVAVQIEERAEALDQLAASVTASAIARAITLAEEEECARVASDIVMRAIRSALEEEQARCDAAAILPECELEAEVTPLSPPAVVPLKVSTPKSAIQGRGSPVTIDSPFAEMARASPGIAARLPEPAMAQTPPPTDLCSALRTCLAVA